MEEDKNRPRLQGKGPGPVDAADGDSSIGGRTLRNEMKEEKENRNEDKSGKCGNGYRKTYDNDFAGSGAHGREPEDIRAHRRADSRRVHGTDQAAAGDLRAAVGFRAALFCHQFYAERHSGGDQLQVHRQEVHAVLLSADCGIRPAHGHHPWIYGDHGYAAGVGVRRSVPRAGHDHLPDGGRHFRGHGFHRHFPVGEAGH